MNGVRTKYILNAFILRWIREWNENSHFVFHSSHLDFWDGKVGDGFSDMFDYVVCSASNGRVSEKYNRALAELFGQIVTKVKTFPTDDGWMIIDKHTKRMLHRGIKNENEVDLICKKNGYIR